MSDKDPLFHICGRIESHMKSFETFEKIRWQAMAFLSAIAVAGLSVVTIPNSPHAAKISAMVLVVFVCLSGIAIQIRVAAVASALWDRIRVLQGTLTENLLQQPASLQLREAVQVPELTSFSNLFRVGIGVHLSICFVFATMAATASGLLAWALGTRGSIAVVSGGLCLVLLTTGFCWWSVKIRKALALSNVAASIPPQPQPGSEA